MVKAVCVETKFRVSAIFNESEEINQQTLETYMETDAWFCKLKYEAMFKTYFIAWLFQRDELKEAIRAFNHLIEFPGNIFFDIELKMAGEHLLTYEKYAS